MSYKYTITTAGDPDCDFLLDASSGGWAFLDLILRDGSRTAVGEINLSELPKGRFSLHHGRLEHMDEWGNPSFVPVQVNMDKTINFQDSKIKIR